MSFEIYFRVVLPGDADGDAFATFVEDEYFPAVHKGPTRVGQVNSLTLLRGVAPTHADTQEFLVRVGFGGLADMKLRIEGDAAQARFDAFGAKLEPMGAYRVATHWSAAN